MIGAMATEFSLASSLAPTRDPFTAAAQLCFGPPNVHNRGIDESCKQFCLGDGMEYAPTA